MTKLRVNILLPRPFWTASNSETSIPNITLSSDVKHRKEEPVYSNFMNRTIFQSTGYFLLFAVILLCTVCTTISFGQTHNIADGKKVFADNHFRFFEEPGQSPKSKASAVFYGALSTLAPAGIGLAVGGDAGTSLIAAGVSIGPMAGILYAGDIDRAAMGLGVRTAGAAMAGVGALFYVFDSLSQDNRLAVGRIMVYSGLTLTATSALYDILFAAPRAVQKNDSKNGPGLNPWIDPFTGSLGLTLNINL